MKKTEKTRFCVDYITNGLTFIMEFLTIAIFTLVILYSPWIIQYLSKLTGE